jgi:hypothetical protein
MARRASVNRPPWAGWAVAGALLAAGAAVCVVVHFRVVADGDRRVADSFKVDFAPLAAQFGDVFDRQSLALQLAADALSMLPYPPTAAQFVRVSAHHMQACMIAQLVYGRHGVHRCAAVLGEGGR